MDEADAHVPHQLANLGSAGADHGLVTAAAGSLDSSSADDGSRPRRFAEVIKSCPVCSTSVNVGDEIYPVRNCVVPADPCPSSAVDDGPAETVNPPRFVTDESDDQVYHKKRWLWGHYACAAKLGGGVPIRPVCPYFHRRGSCAYGDTCFFAHPPSTINAQQGSRRGRKKRKNVGKVGVFRRWLLDMFGQERLCEGSGVIDVAGGKGELAFELQNLNGVPSCVLDPRVVTVVEYASKLSAGLYNRNPVFRGYIDDAVYKNAIAKPATPHHIKMFLTQNTVDWVLGKVDGEPANDKSFFQEAMRGATGKVLVGETSKVQVYERGTSKDRMAILDEATAEVDGLCPAVPISDHAHALHVLKDASVIIGLHPDGAAEPMIDWALQAGKPFACVPCCTCSKDFPQRRLNGKAVRSYPDLCDYLQRKDPRIQRATLDMEGRNIVLFLRSGDIISRRPDEAKQ